MDCRHKCKLVETKQVLGQFPVLFDPCMMAALVADKPRNLKRVAGKRDKNQSESDVEHGNNSLGMVSSLLPSRYFLVLSDSESSNRARPCGNVS
jgi:hypothetical protein